MSISKLNQLFNHVQLEYSLEPTRLKELKQLLLLELKGSTNEYLTIEGVSWSKNDILSYFETDFTAVKEFDLSAFFIQFPQVAFLKDCKQINSLYNLEPAKKHTDFQLFREQESSVFLDDFLKELRYRFQLKDFSKVSQLGNYFAFFDSESQYKIIELVKYQVKSILLERLNRKDLNPKSKLALFTFPNYYRLLLDVLSNETAFLNEQYDLFIDNIEGVDIDTAISIGLKQKQLPLGDSEKTFLDLNINEWRRQRVKESGKESKSNNFRIVYLVVVGLIFIMRLFYNTSNSNRYNQSYYNQNINSNNQIVQRYDMMKTQMFDSTYLYNKLYLSPSIDSTYDKIKSKKEKELITEIQNFTKELILLKEDRDLDSNKFDSNPNKKEQSYSYFNAIELTYYSLIQLNPSIQRINIPK